MANNCPKCGANLALVGRLHRCVTSSVTSAAPVSRETVRERIENKAETELARVTIQPRTMADVAANARQRAKRPSAA